MPRALPQATSGCCCWVPGGLENPRSRWQCRVWDIGCSRMTGHSARFRMEGCSRMDCQGRSNSGAMQDCGLMSFGGVNLVTDKTMRTFSTVISMLAAQNHADRRPSSALTGLEKVAESRV